MAASSSSTGDKAHWAKFASEDADASMGSSEPGGVVQNCPLKSWEPLAEVGDLPAWSPKAELKELPAWEPRAALEEQTDWEPTATIKPLDESGATGTAGVSGEDAPADAEL
jgi:hypothetical protein